MQSRFYVTPEKNKMERALLPCNYAGAIINISDSVVIARALSSLVAIIGPIKLKPMPASTLVRVELHAGVRFN